jgi:hypothetical protein
VVIREARMEWATMGSSIACLMGRLFESSGAG